LGEPMPMQTQTNTVKASMPFWPNARPSFKRCAALLALP
jgi:hypothetical protein